MNQTFQPGFLDEEMKPVFMHYLKSWKEKMIPNIQFNIVDKDSLIDAHKKPEPYRGLIVSVAGFKAYFVDVSSGLPDHIIAGTEHN